MKTSTALVISAFICVIGYTVAAIVLQFVGNEPIDSTLTISWFGFWGLEMGVLGSITTAKAKYAEAKKKKASKKK